MFEEIEIDPRVSNRHPGLSESDISGAWRNAITVIERSGTSLPDVILVAVGADSNGRLLELVGAMTDGGVVHIFHAMTPPSKKTLQETGLIGRRLK